MACGICGGAGHNRRTCSAGGGGGGGQGGGGGYSSAYSNPSYSSGSSVYGYVSSSSRSYSHPAPRRTITCGLCGGEGHNRRTCTVAGGSGSSSSSYISNFNALSSATSSLRSDSPPRRTLTCGSCGMSGHNVRTCPYGSTSAGSSSYTTGTESYRRSSPPRTVTCGKCGRSGHNRRTCPQGDSTARNEVATRNELTRDTSPPSPRTVTSPSKSVTCGICGKQGHNRRTCPMQGNDYLTSMEANSRKCGICGKSGHDKRTCTFTQEQTSSSESLPKKCGNYGKSGHDRRTSITIQEEKPAEVRVSNSSIPPKTLTKKVEDNQCSESTVACGSCASNRHSKLTCPNENPSSVTKDKESKEDKPINGKDGDERKCGLCEGTVHDRRNCPRKKAEEKLTDKAFERWKKGMTKTDGPGHVYIYKKREPRDEDDENWVKIGRSKNDPEERVHQQERTNKEDYKVLWSKETPCRGLMEKVIHKELAEFHCPKSDGDGKTEWFKGNCNILTEKAEKVMSVGCCTKNE